MSDYPRLRAVDYYAVDEHFGSLALLRKLVDEAHRLGLKVIQDQVRPLASLGERPTHCHLV